MKELLKDSKLSEGVFKAQKYFDVMLKLIPHILNSRPDSDRKIIIISAYTHTQTHTYAHRKNLMCP